ncbi:50S ribosomal protein L4 [Mycoplasmopsis maculosa]|uniref:Large ribosomal subunit protein uL4 n=1 Tax=Mycoplasmopsis maculosa TaxID=114885 RepID=A0A449B3D1_9BACT|nr:50S ribosomal protein L4 [Mycoplasmopsis maculosa]VEU75111.1 50S ribosomal protein L4 [Mycoplasmopsis maculosa]
MSDKELKKSSTTVETTTDAASNTQTTTKRTVKTVMTTKKVNKLVTKTEKIADDKFEKTYVFDFPENEVQKIEAPVKPPKPAAAKVEVKKETSKPKTETKVKEVVKKTQVKKEEAKEAPIKKEAPKAKKLSLNPVLFDSEKIYEQAIFDTIMSERASLRQGTHDVKSRAEVRGGGKKPWRQKGTGRARAGSTRSPIWVGGGRAFGPTPERNYTLKVNKKVRFAAFVSALTLLARNNQVILDDMKLESISTKAAVAKLEELKIKDLKHILIVTTDETLYKSVANLKNVIAVKPNSVSIEKLVWADVLVLSEEGLKNFEGRLK